MEVEISLMPYPKFLIAEDFIRCLNPGEYGREFNLKDNPISKGLLVKEHYQQVEQALSAALLIRYGKIIECVSFYDHTAEELKDFHPLAEVVTELEKQLDLITKGAYGIKVEELKPNYCGNRHYWNYDYLLKGLAFDINLLKERKYYERNSFYARRGVPRITTIGKRVVDRVMLLVWQMDNEPLAPK